VGADATYALPDRGGSIGADTTTSLSPVIALVFGQSGFIAGASLEGVKYTRIIP
jgi:lipid-binding SYLF domain-containing protein